MILGSTLDHIFGPKKVKLFCPILVFRRCMSNAICDLVLYLQSEDLNISWIYPGTTPFQYLKMVYTIQYSTLSLIAIKFNFLKCSGYVWDLAGKFRQKWIHLFWASWSLSFKFFFKRENHGEHPLSKCGWINALHNRLLYQGLGTCFGDARILVWYLFSIGILKPSLLHSI